LIPDKIIQQYKLLTFLNNDHVYVRIDKGMYTVCPNYRKSKTIPSTILRIVGTLR
jgi:hypothetical protein